jgi:SAM-dependent methyltransferase
MDVKETAILGADADDHWYYRSKAAAMTRLLHAQAPTVILDVGAGSGFFSSYLLRHTTATEAWCVDISYGCDSDTQTQGKPMHFRRSVESVDADLVLLMDVLEHVDDDTGLLVDSVRKVPDGARFLLSAPAFQFLWSGHDEYLGHRRRYTLHQLEATARRAGLRVVHGAYYFGLVFPLAAVTRLAQRRAGSGKAPPRSQLTRHGALVNGALAGICRAELPLLGINRLAGLTAFCLAEKT